jgi:hypothetical protein
MTDTSNLRDTRLAVLDREQPVPGETRLLLLADTTRLVLRHGPGRLPEDLRMPSGSELPVEVAGATARYCPALWTAGRAQLVWERGDHWFQLIGAAGRDLLLDAAGTVATRADLTT